MGTPVSVQASDIVILALGIDGSVEGESHDRTSIALPGVQVCGRTHGV